MNREEMTKELAELKQRTSVLETELMKVETAEPDEWKPRRGGAYYFIGNSISVVKESWNGVQIDYNRYSVGNCFPTEERAEQVAEKIRMLLLLEWYHDMFCPDYVPDWEDISSLKFYLNYVVNEEQWRTHSAYRYKEDTQVYFDSEETAQKVCDLLNHRTAE